MNILYTAPHCPMCKMAERKLEEAGIPFTVIEDPNEAMLLGIRSAPYLVMYNGERMQLPQIIEYCKEAKQ